jgi:hypothetical protein
LLAAHFAVPPEVIQEGRNDLEQLPFAGGAVGSTGSRLSQEKPSLSRRIVTDGHFSPVKTS